MKNVDIENIAKNLYQRNQLERTGMSNEYQKGEYDLITTYIIQLNK